MSAKVASPFWIDLGETKIGDSLLQVVDTRDRRSRNRRELAIFVYALGAELEQRSNAVDARWTIATNVPDSQIAIETRGGAEAQDAWQLATDVLWELGFR